MNDQASNKDRSISGSAGRQKETQEGVFIPRAVIDQIKNMVAEAGLEYKNAVTDKRRERAKGSLYTLNTILDLFDHNEI